MTSKRNNPNIKAKLLLGYTLTIIAVVAVGFITYISFTRLLDSVETLAQPDTKLIRLNHMLTDISEAEGSLRSYILSDNKTHLEAYQVKLDSIRSNLAALKYASEDDPTQLIKLDSVSILLKAKYDALDELVSLTRRSRNNSFSSKALDRIEKTHFDSAKIDTTLMTYTETTTHIKPLGIIDEHAVKPEAKGLFQAIKNLFSSKEEEEEVTTPEGKEEEYYTETKVTIDTSIVSAYQPDTILSNIKRILSEVQKKESALNSLLTSKQLEILEQDRLIMDKLRVIVTSLERREILKAEQQTQHAKVIADKFSFTILGVGILGLLAGTVLVILILHDINKSNYYKQQLEKAKNKAEHLAKAKEEFLANMSHEIRTPLNAIQGFTEQLLLTSLHHNQQEYLHAVQQSSAHLLSTVNDILDYSKIEAGKLTLEKIPFQPHKVIEEVYTALKLKAAEKKLTFNFFIEEDCPEGLLGDPFRLKQILFNLVGNALKFTDSGSVFIICKCRKAFASPKKIVLNIQVKDTGVGISEKNIHKIFEGFQQADSSTTRQYGGTGLGLTICKNLAELQNGVLLAESEVGNGSTFSINIPYDLCKLQNKTERKPSTGFSAQMIKGLNILVMDDDNLNSLLLNTILNKYGGQTVLAQNGADGMEKVKKHPFDLIITDIQMPQMSGFEFASALRSSKGKNHQTPIIGLSAHVTKKEMEAAEKAGLTTLLAKPFREKLLLESISNILDLKTSPIPISGAFEGKGDNPPSLDYDLTGFDSFIKGDKKALINLLEALVNDQKKNLTLLKAYEQDSNLKKIAELAHKMNASFAYLKAETIVNKLKKLETEIKKGGDTSPEDFQEVIAAIIKEAMLIIAALEKVLVQMKTENLPV